VKAPAAPVWALSFADLLILLLAFFVMLHAQSGHQAQIVQGIRQALGSAVAASSESHDIDPKAVFELNEAVLKPPARAALQALGRHAALSGGHVRIESIGADRNTSRFDGWELAAARAAAVARAIQAGGLSEQRIMISIPEMNGTAGRDGQHIAIDLVPHG